MTAVEVVVREAETLSRGQDNRGNVLMLPGRAYSCEQPLLARATHALRSAGWRVLQAAWHLEALPADPRRFVEGAAAQLESEAHRQEGPVLVVAKSLGTLAAHWSADRGYAAVWLTPVLRAEGLNPLPVESRELARRLRTYPRDNLVVGGTADVFWMDGFAGTGRVIEVAGADHSLDLADQDASLRQHEGIAAAIVDFASRVHPS